MRIIPAMAAAFLVLLSLLNIPVLTQSELTTSGHSTSPKYPQSSTSSTSNNNDLFMAHSPIIPPPPPEKHHRTHKEKIYSWMTAFFSGVIAGGLSGYVLCWVYKTRKPSVPKPQNDWMEKVDYDHPFAFLKRRDSLNELPVIGRGGCGEVYRAQVRLTENGEIQHIAIKKVIEIEEQNEDRKENKMKKNKKMQQIISEIMTVGGIRHRNILPLLAHVPRQDCQLLVYPLRTNGSLQDVLNEVANGTRKLNWPTRLQIAQGVAAGLEHLHTGHSPGILHRDLKPANILLDDGMVAQISDFGLALAITDCRTHVTVSRLGGTLGYMAPEYCRGMLRYSAKCDIYSFGVVLGVLLTGKFPLDVFFRKKVNMSLVDWIRKTMESGNPRQVIDPNLMTTGRYVDEMLEVLKIAIGCTLVDPKQRPTSRVVSLTLSRISRNRKMLINDYSSIYELSEMSDVSQIPEEDGEGEGEMPNDTEVSGRLSRIRDLSRYYASSSLLSTATGQQGSFSTRDRLPPTVETDEAEGHQHEFDTGKSGG